MSCRNIKLSNANSTKFLNINIIDQNFFNELKVGAAIFKRIKNQKSGDDKWFLIGFTNSDGKVSSLSLNDCKKLINKTSNRVHCLSNVDDEKNIDLFYNANIQQFISNPFTNNNTISLIEENQLKNENLSLLILTITLGIIVIFGIILLIIQGLKHQKTKSYETI